MNDITNTTRNTADIDDTEGHASHGRFVQPADEVDDDVEGNAMPDIVGRKVPVKKAPARRPRTDDVEGHATHGRFVQPADEAGDDVEGHGTHARF